MRKTLCIFALVISVFFVCKVNAKNLAEDRELHKEISSQFFSVMDLKKWLDKNAKSFYDYEIVTISDSINDYHAVFYEDRVMSSIQQSALIYKCKKTKPLCSLMSVFLKPALNKRLSLKLKDKQIFLVDKETNNIIAILNALY